MKISIDRNVVELVPQNQQETADLETLWRIVVDCANDSKKMVPIGEYIPAKNNLARFMIEGVAGGKPARADEEAPEDNTYHCMVCNKYMQVKAGEQLPLCCSVVMKAID